MERDNYANRLREIQHFIIEISTGNFSFRLEPGDTQDEFETIIVLLNMMAEELRSLFHQINPGDSAKHTLEMAFILDENLKIIKYSTSVSDLLLLKPEELIQMPFKNILAKESKERFKNELTGNKGSKEDQNIELKLNFKTSESLIVPVDCFFQKINPEIDQYLLVALRTIYRNKELEKILKNSSKIGSFTKNGILRLEFNRRLIKRLHFYILENLDRPLPSLKDIATHFGTNETKLKNGFKQMYGITIYRFHNEKRLNKALSLIRNTELSIKEISSECGFKDFPHFSRKFKKRFGYRPIDLRRNSK